MTCAPSSPGLAVAVTPPAAGRAAALQRRALPHPSRGAGAARAARVQTAARAGARRPPLGRLGLGRAARCAPPPAACHAGAHRGGGTAAAAAPSPRRRPRAGTRAGALPHLELVPSRGRRPTSCWAPTSGEAERAALYEESGGNPFYLEQLARSLARRRAARRPHRDPARGRRGPARRGRRARRGARAALGRGPARAGGSGGGRRSVRARDRRGRRRDVRGGGGARARRAAAARSRAPHRGAATLPVPPPARPAGRLRGRAGRLAARSPRAQRRGARDARRSAGGPRPPRRALGAPRRRRAVAMLREAGEETVDRRRAARRAGSEGRCDSCPHGPPRRARRAAPGARGGARGIRPVRRGPRRLLESLALLPERASWLACS